MYAEPFFGKVKGNIVVLEQLRGTNYVCPRFMEDWAFEILGNGTEQPCLNIYGPLQTRKIVFGFDGSIMYM